MPDKTVVVITSNYNYNESNISNSYHYLIVFIVMNKVFEVINTNSINNKVIKVLFTMLIIVIAVIIMNMYKVLFSAQ